MVKVLLRTEGGETPAWLMAALIYGGGWRVTECCHLRMTDLDFDQGLVLIRSGKGDKGRSTLLAEVDREKLRAQLQRVEADAGAVIRRPPQGGVASVAIDETVNAASRRSRATCTAQ